MFSFVGLKKLPLTEVQSPHQNFRKNSTLKKINQWSLFNPWTGHQKNFLRTQNHSFFIQILSKLGLLSTGVDGQMAHILALETLINEFTFYFNGNN